MTKRKYTFGHKYLLRRRFGIAMVRGERYYFVSDGYTKWLITDINYEKQEVEVKVWASTSNVATL